MGISPVRLLSFTENLPSTFIEFKKKSDQYVYLEQDSNLIWENFLPVRLLGPVRQFGSQEYSTYKNIPTLTTREKYLG